MKRLNARQGFTLFELLVSIVIMGLVTTIGSFYFVKMTTLWSETTSKTLLDSRADRALESIRKDIATTLAPELTGMSIVGAQSTAQDDRQFFRGQDLADDVLVIPAQLGVGVAGRERSGVINYHIERQLDDPESPSSTLVRWLSDLDDPLMTEGRLAVCEDVIQFRVEFAARENAYEWLPEWSGRVLPGAVRVSLTVHDANRPYLQVSHSAVFPIRIK